MQLSDISSLIVSIFSLLVSAFVAYRTLLWKFIGKLWHSNAVVLTHIDGIPSIGIACYAENKGAQPGYLEDLRLEVMHTQTSSRYLFYPVLVRDDYNIFESYKASAWYPFSGFYLLPCDSIKEYVLFKPHNDKFVAEKGDYGIKMQVRWRGSKNWATLPSNLSITLSDEIASLWNNPEAPAYQVFSEQILEHRRLLGG